jgi:hypothetical protein
MTLLPGSIQRLKQKAADLADDLATLETLLELDVPSSLNKIRFIAEKVLQMLCKNKGVSWGQAEPTLERMIGPLVAAGCLPKSVAIHLRTVQMNTSPGSHYQESALSRSHVTIAQNALIEFLEWYYHQANAQAGASGPEVSAAGPLKAGYRAFRPAVVAGLCLACLVTAAAVFLAPQPDRQQKENVPALAAKKRDLEVKLKTEMEKLAETTVALEKQLADVEDAAKQIKQSVASIPSHLHDSQLAPIITEYCEHFDAIGWVGGDGTRGFWKTRAAKELLDTRENGKTRRDVSASAQKAIDDSVAAITSNSDKLGEAMARAKKWAELAEHISAEVARLQGELEKLDEEL